MSLVTRFEAERGNTVRLRARFTGADILTDPDSITKVEIRIRTGATDTALIDTIAAASVVQEETGVFYVDWAIPADADVGMYVDRWFFTVNPGDPETSNDNQFPVYTQGALAPASGYISVADVRELYLPGSGRTDAQIQQAIDEATEWIYFYTGRRFGEQSTSYTVDGTGEAWVILPTPAILVSSISVTPPGGTTESLDPNDFVINGRWLISKNFVPGREWDRSGCFICGCPFGDVFARGQKNVTVTGTFGTFATVPALVKKLAGLFAMYSMQDDNRLGVMGMNYDSESVEQHSYSRRATDTLAQVHLRGATGIPEIDSIMNLLRRPGRAKVI